MALSSTIQSALQRHQATIQEAMHNAFMKVQAASTDTETNDLQAFYGQIQYHLGWVNADFVPTHSNPGKLLRPTLLLLAYEASGAWGLTESKTYLHRALPAAAAIELTHNFTLIHDDIEDGDAERRHRPTLWKRWGIPQAINTGDGLFALSRLVLWDVLAEGVEGDIAARLGALLDHTCLVIAEGQYLDISFEGRQDISVAMYLDMIRRKTAALMACAAEMGAYLGTRDMETIRRLRDFGNAMGIAFQVRDDLLGVWATTTELGKTPAGDVYRRKKSLPILHALENANSHDQQFLLTVYQQETPITNAQVEAVLAIFERTHTQTYCRAFLAEQCHLAYEALASVPYAVNPQAVRAIEDMNIMVHFVEEAVKG
ncbi:MAG TPA: polyprenyl synthetase family protein [Ktedonobacteraceae bacterium]|nr:polyprenyl synthetase family protein [Ktedonobacteraceae bacterium]